MEVVNSNKIINISGSDKVKEILNASDTCSLKKDDVNKTICISKKDNVQINPIINKTQENEVKEQTNSNEDNKQSFSVRMKQKYLPMATEMIGLGKDVGENLAKVDSYTVIKEGSIALGFKEEASEEIATKFSKRQFDKTINSVALKVVEKVPVKFIELELRKTMTQEITEALSKNLTNSVSSIKLDTKYAIVTAMQKGKDKGIATLAEKGLLKTAPDAFKATRYIPTVSLITSVRTQGVVGGVMKYAEGKVVDLGNFFFKNSTNAVKTQANIAEKIIVSSKQNAIRTSEATVEKALRNSTERVTNNLLEKGIKATTSAQKKLLQTNITKATETAIIKTTEKTSVKLATNAAKALPYITAAAEGYIMFKDIQVANDVYTDPHASDLSKFFATSTVALDGVSMATHLSGMGLKVGMIAGGLSIATSLATHITR